MGTFMFQQFESFKKLSIVGDIRGKGMLLGMELVKDKERKIPFDRSLMLAETIVQKAFEKGLIILSALGIGEGFVGDLIVISGNPLRYRLEEGETEKPQGTEDRSKLRLRRNLRRENISYARSLRFPTPMS